MHVVTDLGTVSVSECLKLAKRNTAGGIIKACFVSYIFKFYFNRRCHEEIMKNSIQLLI